MDLLLIPLADVDAFAIGAELGAGELGEGDLEIRVEALARNEAANEAVVLGGFAREDAEFVADGEEAEGIAGSLCLPKHVPCCRIDLVDRLSLERAHPKVSAVPREGLGKGDVGGLAAEFFDRVHGQKIRFRWNSIHLREWNRVRDQRSGHRAIRLLAGCLRG